VGELGPEPGLSGVQDLAKPLSRELRRPRLSGHHDLVWALAMLSPALIALVMFRALPLVAAVVGSVQHDRLGTVTRTFVGFENYATALASPEFAASLRVTLAFALVVNPLQIALAFGLALLFAERIKGAGSLRSLLFLPVVVPPAVAALVFGFAMKPGGPINAVLASLGIGPQPFLLSSGQALASIVLIVSWEGIGYWAIFLVAGLLDIPSDYEEAAAIDGAGWWRTTRSIVIPLMRRTLAFVLVADTVTNFLLFAPIQVLTNGGPAGSTNVLMYEIYQQTYTLLNPNLGFPEVVLLMVIVLLIVIVQFHLLRSLEQ
jgi:multiple sugar transport system permease protein